MQHKRLILSLTLALCLAAVNARGDEETAADEETDTTTEPSNIEGWEEEDPENENWTWWGMGYESRRPSVGPGSSGGKR